MTASTQRITTAAAAFAFSLALIANTVSMPAPTASANPAALQEMI